MVKDITQKLISVAKGIPYGVGGLGLVIGGLTGAGFMLYKCLDIPSGTGNITDGIGVIGLATAGVTIAFISLGGGYSLLNASYNQLKRIIK